MNILSQIFITSIVVIVFVIVSLFIYYSFTRKQYKNQKEHFQQLHQNLATGQKVEFSNGLVGVIDKVDTEYCDIKIKSGAVITVSRYAISKIVK